MKILLKITTFITSHDDGTVTFQSERAVAIDGVAFEIQIDGFGADQDWRGALRREGHPDLIEAVQRLLTRVEGISE